MQQRKIIHIDMDCFYAAIEVRDNPALQGKPVAVGGQPNTRGVLCTCNYEARKFGIHSAMPSSHAARLCPELTILPVNFDKYRKASREIREIFHHYTDLIEPLSLDEAYLDVSGSPLHSGSATLIAAQIRQEIFESQRITASAGIAPNKMLAKIASDWNKPNGQFVITPDKVEAFIAELPVKKLFGVGKVTAEKLHKHNINTCGDIQKYPLTEFVTLFGHWGGHLHKIAQGIDDRSVITEWKRKSLSVENTFNKDYPANALPSETLSKLFEELSRRLEKSDKNESDIKSIFIKIKYSDFTSTTAQLPCSEFCYDAYTLLFHKKSKQQNNSIRLLGFGVYFNEDDKQNPATQLSLDL
ncbi:DNA polymerase IV [Pseudomonadota bacterium]